MLRITLFWCGLVGGLCSLLGAAVPASQTPETMLGPTQRWLGGTARLASVRSLEIAESDALTLRVLFPDRYQIEAATDTGTMTTSFNGKEIFTEFPAGFTGAPTAALPPAEARRRGLYNMAVYGLMYLARTLPEVPMKAVRLEQTCGNVPGTCLEFQPVGGAPIRLVVGADGRPVALVRRIGGGSGAPQEESVYLLDDYRVVDGIRMPFRVTSKRVSGADRSERVVFTRAYRSVIINPPVEPSLFERRKK